MKTSPKKSLKKTLIALMAPAAFGPLLMLAPSGSAFAQGSTGAAAANATGNAAPAERIEVTGSRIRSLSAESPSPLQVLNAEDIARSGAINLQELLLKNPTLGTPGVSRTNSNFSTSSAGVSTIDLRGLGSDRTLVLVNGRRFVAGIPGSATVDLNTIPTDFIERVELLTGGSSATYGSEAVAGVVNIILKRNFQGLVLDASVGQSEERDDTKQRFSITLGGNVDEGKGNLIGHFAYSKQGVVLGRNRPGGEVDSISTGAGVTGEAGDILKVTTPFLSSFAPQGRFLPNTGAADSRTFDRDGNLIPFSTNGPAGDGVGASGFNRQAFRTLAVPTERFLLATQANYAVAPDHTVFLEGTYAATQTKSELEAFPLDSANIYPVLGPSRGRAPAEARVGGAIVRNPLVPDSLFSLLRDTDGDGLRDYGFTRRLSEVGTRGNVADRGTFRVATGISGALAKGWDYQAFASYGSTSESQVSSGQVNVLNFRNALDAVPDTDDVNGNGNRVEAICRDATARAQGCQALNLFGFNSISPGALRYVTAPGLLATFTTQKNAAVSVSGEAFQLPAGAVGVAAGAEYREEFSRSEFDPLQQAGLNAGNAIPRTEGQYDVKELFAEVRVPLLKDAPLAKALSASAAVRGSRYSTVGSVTSWNTGLEWSPVASLKVRATRALSTRAPNVGELYSPASQDFPAGLADPCVGVTATTSGARAATCRADTGVAANIAANGTFRLAQPDIQGISGFNIGNASLEAEKGNSFTLGLVFAPTDMPLLKNSSFTIDYFKIRVTDPIAAPERQFILDQCYGGDASFCRFIERRPLASGVNSAGSIEFIDAVQRNGDERLVEGVDLTVSHIAQVGPGRLSARLAYTHLMKSYERALAGVPADEIAGEVGSARDKAQLQLGYSWGGFGISTTTTYIAASAIDDQYLAQFEAAPGSVKVAARSYTDMQFTYTHGNLRWYLGIDNAFGTKPPVIPSAVTGNVTGSTTASDVYDAIGRRYYVGVRASF
jgi:iron complex outermembrane recepter protein